MTRDSTTIYAGFISGVTTSAMFNPYDRALYLSVKNNSPFLSKQNWTHPWQGYAQAAAHRTLSNSVYFMTQDSAREKLFSGLEGTPKNLAVGLVAGSVYGVMLNPLTLVKYHSWNLHGEARYWQALKDILQKSGPAHLRKGALVTVLRDATFGVTYELMRCFSEEPGFAVNAFAAGVATVVSGPFNYARLMKFATPPDQKPPGIWQSMSGLAREGYDLGLSKGLRHWQSRMRIGWGTARVAVGMATGQLLFDAAKKLLQARTTVLEPQS